LRREKKKQTDKKSNHVVPLGKTTFAGSIVYSINVKIQMRVGIPIATAIPMDGYHYTRAQLDAMQNPQEAHERRGAPFTFDAAGFYQLVQKLTGPVIKPRPAGSSSGGGDDPPKAEWVKAPSFDHAVKVRSCFSFWGRISFILLPEHAMELCGCVFGAILFLHIKEQDDDYRAEHNIRGYSRKGREREDAG